MHLAFIKTVRLTMSIRNSTHLDILNQNVIVFFSHFVAREDTPNKIVDTKLVFYNTATYIYWEVFPEKYCEMWIESDKVAQNIWSITHQGGGIRKIIKDKDKQIATHSSIGYRFHHLINEYWQIPSIFATDSSTKGQK